MRILLTIATLLACLSIFAQDSPKSGKFGRTRKTAIIADARTAQEGLAFEHKWIEKNYPYSDIIDFNMEGAGKYENGIPNRLYDIYLIKTKDKKKFKIYFMVMYYHGRN